MPELEATIEVRCADLSAAVIEIGLHPASVITIEEGPDLMPSCVARKTSPSWEATALSLRVCHSRQ